MGGLGHILLGLAGALSVPMMAGPVDWRARAAVGQMVALVAAFAVLLYLFATSDFSIMTVFKNSHSLKPTIYKYSAAWGNHEGSMLLWGVMTSVYVGAFALWARRRMETRWFNATLAVCGVSLLGIVAFIGLLSSPFAGVAGPVPADGMGLNPLLQDIGLAIHPPVLYLGYVGCLIPFALAVSALWVRANAKDWATLVKPWAFLSLGFLTLGIGLGSWWAYRELGWGGWWFWDPVENVSLLPWLLGVALVHSIRVVQVKGALANWSFALAIAAFGFVLLGTFLVRSGLLVSVHAFAADPSRGMAILAYFTVLIGGAMLLLTLRGYPAQAAGGTTISREGAILAHNLMLVAITATVFLGTMYPPLMQALNQPPLSVGAPYYQATVLPIGLLAILLMAVGPQLPWSRAALMPVLRRQKWLILASLVTGLVTWGLTDMSPFGAAGLAAGLMLLAISAKSSTRASAHRRKNSWPLWVSHAGVGVFALAAVLTETLTIEADREMQPGESFTAGASTVTLSALAEDRGENYLSVLARVIVERAGREHILIPEYRYYPAREIPTTEADIATSIFRDLRVSLNVVEGRDGVGSVWALRFHDRPAMIWLWIGMVATALGLFGSSAHAFRETVRLA